MGTLKFEKFMSSNISLRESKLRTSDNKETLNHGASLTN